MQKLKIQMKICMFPGYFVSLLRFQLFLHSNFVNYLNFLFFNETKWDSMERNKPDYFLFTKFTITLLSCYLIISIVCNLNLNKIFCCCHAYFTDISKI